MHISVAVPMAMVRMLTHGAQPGNWKHAFTLFFFGYFYFIVLAALSALKTAIRHASRVSIEEMSVAYSYLMQLANYAGVTMFVIGVPVFWLMFHHRDELEDPNDWIYLLICLICGLHPLTMSLYHHVNPLSVSVYLSECQLCISFLTLYVLTVVTEAINITYFMGAPAAVILVIVALPYVLCVVSFWSV
jgi:hypothetical protein